MRKALGCIGRQPGDQIHVDVVKAQLARQMKRVDRLLCRVLAPDTLQNAVIEGLGVDRDPCDRMLLQGKQLFTGHGVGATCFYGELGAIGQIDIRLDLVEQQIELFRGQGRWCAAADVDRFTPQAQLFCELRRITDLGQQEGQVFADQLLRLLDRLTDERAVIAPRRTEGDAHIERERAAVGA